ncbi:MAG: C45 family autoproteolytic acyltransferase/hydrolase [Planctomycetota bacterium]|nr:C45 family autoproteolytic acyltransferase/hydrolase [Planctomycetota bacterium]
MDMSLALLSVDARGRAWKDNFKATWPDYRQWYLCEGEGARPRYPACLAALEQHMPELVPRFHRLAKWAGGGDLAARFLSMYRPPPYLAGCTQTVWQGPFGPLLMRNYDYDLRWFEGLVLRTEWLKPVIGVSDCLWGLLDGMNADGLCASLTFGGSRDVRPGFGIPLLIRYVLETCSTVAEARAVFERVPVHMTYNVTLLDRAGDHCVLYLKAGGGFEVSDRVVCTNHQATVKWPEYEATTATRERQTYLEERLLDPTLDQAALAQLFLAAPLYQHHYDRSFGTLYTSCWSPASGTLDLYWPSVHTTASFDSFPNQNLLIELAPI